MGEHAFELFAGGETYKVNAAGHITCAVLGWAYSGKWTMAGLSRRSNFGHVVEHVPFTKLADFIASKPQWCRKNGAPIWYVDDIDHGTRRQWGCGVLYVRPAR